ncbi:uncharacterized protein BO72DRAFT_247000 [Aspergillus fijiensis CBS 313.89]|uniref:Secreted protein n=1 Tax=Aspergillus fijiensis CBS 313.89 TaxID=1448319 RepID=A0A8G1RI51_9EURO|nr:uncharacterized protein BO72DRAFT_247000 [Aspergillus fijiensis CBS 313.89]RAK73244.1 hypothetical protein BO72DRAFT_247000 [Aspergillus fijiensis CBS 313.89]
MVGSWWWHFCIFLQARTCVSQSVSHHNQPIFNGLKTLRTVWEEGFRRKDVKYSINYIHKDIISHNVRLCRYEARMKAMPAKKGERKKK